MRRGSSETWRRRVRDADGVLIRMGVPIVPATLSFMGCVGLGWYGQWVVGWAGALFGAVALFFTLIALMQWATAVDPHWWEVWRQEGTSRLTRRCRHLFVLRRPFPRDHRWLVR